MIVRIIAIFTAPVAVGLKTVEGGSRFLGRALAEVVEEGRSSRSASGTCWPIVQRLKKRCGCLHGRSSIAAEPRCPERGDPPEERQCRHLLSRTSLLITVISDPSNNRLWHHT
jgi:hypothetical protein